MNQIWSFLPSLCAYLPCKICLELCVSKSDEFVLKRVNNKGWGLSRGIKGYYCAKMGDWWSREGRVLIVMLFMTTSLQQSKIRVFRIWKRKHVLNESKIIVLKWYESCFVVVLLLFFERDTRMFLDSLYLYTAVQLLAISFATRSLAQKTRVNLRSVK